MIDHVPDSFFEIFLEYILTEINFKTYCCTAAKFSFYFETVGIFSDL